uniref:Uncharacterized protein n=1 Tax=Rhizophora mucronata TaxID=61149 RepID=A0A2P2NKP2_RHIMU
MNSYTGWAGPASRKKLCIFFVTFVRWND